MGLFAPKFPPGWHEDSKRRAAEFLCDADPIDFDLFDGRTMAKAGRTIVFNLPPERGLLMRLLLGLDQKTVCHQLLESVKLFAGVEGIDFSMEVLPHEALARVKFKERRVNV